MAGGAGVVEAGGGGEVFVVCEPELEGGGGEVGGEFVD